MWYVPWLPDGYRPHVWFWEQLVILRKVVLIMLSVFYTNKPNVASYWAVLAMMVALVLQVSQWCRGAQRQALSACLTCEATLLLWRSQVHFRPYESNTLNNLEMVSIGSTIATQFGTILYALDSSVNGTVLTVVLVGVNAATLTVFAITIVRIQHVTRTKRKRQQRAKREMSGRLPSARAIELSAAAGQSPQARLGVDARRRDRVAGMRSPTGGDSPGAQAPKSARSRASGSIQV